MDIVFNEAQSRFEMRFPGDPETVVSAARQDQLESLREYLQRVNTPRAMPTIARRRRRRERAPKTKGES